jgi:hypothetical protein
MSKIIFVIGATGTGKSTFIQNKFADPKKFFRFDMALQSQKLFDDIEALDDLSNLADIYNTLTEEGMFALFDGLALVVEYCITGNDGDFTKVLKQARKSGIRTEVIQIVLDKDIAWERIHQTDSSYFPSANTNEETLEILMGVIESYSMNLDFEEICTIGMDDGFLLFFRRGDEGKDTYFFVKDDTEIFDFEPKFEFQKSDDTFYVKEYSSLEEAVDDLLGQFEFSGLYPLKVNEKYKDAFQKVYHQHIQTSDTSQLIGSDWSQILN